MYKVKPEEIVSYFNKFVDYPQVKQLQSLSAAGGAFYLGIQIKQHNLHFHCHHFLCQLCRTFLSVLFERGHQKLLNIVNNTNYNHITDEEVYQKINV